MRWRVNPLIIFEVSCAQLNGITPKICMLCFVLINSVILNLSVSCVWIQDTLPTVFSLPQVNVYNHIHFTEMCLLMHPLACKHIYIQLTICSWIHSVKMLSLFITEYDACLWMITVKEQTSKPNKVYCQHSETETELSSSWSPSVL